MTATVQLASVRCALFLLLIVLSVPLSYPVGRAILSPLLLLAPSPLPDTAFWHAVDDYLFDLPAKWSYLVVPLEGFGISGEGPFLTAYGIPIAITFWTMVGIAYGWLTRGIRMRYVALSVLPTVWVVGIAIHLALNALFDIYVYASL